MQTTDLKDLMETVEMLRQELHPNLDARFLRAVILAEESNPEDDVEAVRSIHLALTELLDVGGSV